MRYYEAVVKYEKTGDEGKLEKVTEQYLLDALSITESEANLIKDLEPFIKGECVVTSVKLAKYMEYVPFNLMLSLKVLGVNIFEVNADVSAPDNCKFFAVKVSFLNLDDKGKTKKTPYHYLVQAEDINQAERSIKFHIKGSMEAYEINNIVETKIVDVIAYKVSE